MKSMPKGQTSPMSLHGAGACRVVTKACGQALGSTLSTEACTLLPFAVSCRPQRGRQIRFMTSELP